MARAPNGKNSAPSDTMLTELASIQTFNTLPDVNLLDRIAASLTREAKQSLGAHMPTATPKPFKQMLHAFLMNPTPSAVLPNAVLQLLSDVILKAWGAKIAATTGKVGNEIGHQLRLVESCTIKEANAETAAYLDVTKKYGEMSGGINFARVTCLTALKEVPKDVAAIVRGETTATTDCEIFVAQASIANALGPLVAHKLDKTCTQQFDHVTTGMAVHILLQTTYGKDLTAAINAGKLTSTVSCQGELPPKKKVWNSKNS